MDISLKQDILDTPKNSFNFVVRLEEIVEEFPQIQYSILVAFTGKAHAAKIRKIFSRICQNETSGSTEVSIESSRSPRYFLQ